MVHDKLELDSKNFPVLAVLYPDELQFLRSIAKTIELAADVPVIMEGQQPESLFLIQTGLLVVNKRHDKDIFEVGSLTPGEIFGEAGVLFNTPAGAEVRSIEPVTLLAIPAEQAREIINKNSRFAHALAQLAERRSAASALAVNPIFSKLPIAVRETLLYNAQYISYKPGDVVFEEGDEDIDEMFLVLSGEARASISHPSDEDKETMVAHISSGDEVGEISVISGRPRAATVTALTPLRLLTIKMESVDAWRRRYSDFGYALYAQVQGKMQRALAATRPQGTEADKPSEAAEA